MENRKQEQSVPYGVGGWLALLVFLLLVLRPLEISVFTQFHEAERANPNLLSIPQYMQLRKLTFFCIGLSVGVSIIGGLMLVFSRQRSAVVWAYIAIWSGPILSLVLLAGQHTILGEADYKALGRSGISSFILLFFVTISTVLWHAYLSRSKRVKSTYKDRIETNYSSALVPPTAVEAASQDTHNRQVHQDTDSTSIADGERAHIFWPDESSMVPPKTLPPVVSIDTDHIYAEIAKELEDGVVDKGLWTRLFAECDGDERRTKVLYIRQRANRLISAERLRLEHEALERTTATDTIKERSLTPSDAQLMDAYGISFENERYTYGEYKYEKLADAVNYAKLQAQSGKGTFGRVSGEEAADYEGAYESGDYVSALRAARAAANQGYAAAQFFLGEMYTKGKGIPEDKVEAAKWYQQAANQGYAKAQYRLGMIHVKGLEGTPNYAEAVKWLRLAADQGHAHAQNSLAIRYATGQGVPRDDSQAFKWLKLAADQGHPHAQKNIDELKEVNFWKR